MTERFSTPAVVLAGSPHGNLGIVRTLGRLGVPVFVVGPGSDSPAAQSRYTKGVFRGDFAATSVENRVRALIAVGQEINTRSVLFPTSDEDAIFAAEHFDRLKEWFIYPQQTPSLPSSLASKKQMYFLAKRHGIPTPEASFPLSAEDVMAFSESASFPVMVKGIDGARLKRALGAGVIIAANRSALLDLYQRVEASERSNVMLQEYVPGGDDAIWMFNGYFDSNSNCLFGVTGRKIRQYPVYVGQTSLGICLRNDVVYETTVRWMKELAYKGTLDIGYRYDARDGQYKVLDVNPRIGATFRLFADQNGMDVARALYLDLLGNKVSAAQVREGRKWLVEDCDIGSSLRYWKDGKLSFLRWLKSLRGVNESAYFALDDLRPFWNMCMRSFTIWSRSRSILKPKASHPRSSSRIYVEETRLLNRASEG